MWLWNPGKRSLKATEIGTICVGIMYCFITVFSNLVRKTHCFWDIQLQKCRDLEKRVRGPWRSLEMSPFDREPMTSYWCSIVPMALSRVISEIFNVEKYRDLEIQVTQGHRNRHGSIRRPFHLFHPRTQQWLHNELSWKIPSQIKHVDLVKCKCQETTNNLKQMYSHVGYPCANFGLPRPLCSRLRPDARDRQMSDRRQTQASLNAPPIRGGV